MAQAGRWRRIVSPSGMRGAGKVSLYIGAGVIIRRLAAIGKEVLEVRAVIRGCVGRITERIDVGKERGNALLPVRMKWEKDMMRHGQSFR